MVRLRPVRMRDAAQWSRLRLADRAFPSVDRPAEFDLIARHFRPLAGPGGLGLRDDAAVLMPPAGRELVLTADAMVGGVHFLPDDPPDLIGRWVRDARAGFYASSSWVRRHGHPRTAAQAARHAFVGSDRSGRYLEYLRGLGLPVDADRFSCHAQSTMMHWVLMPLARRTSAHWDDLLVTSLRRPLRLIVASLLLGWVEDLYIMSQATDCILMPSTVELKPNLRSSLFAARGIPSANMLGRPGRLRSRPAPDVGVCPHALRWYARSHDDGADSADRPAPAGEGRLRRSDGHGRTQARFQGIGGAVRSARAGGDRGRG